MYLLAQVPFLSWMLQQTKTITMIGSTYPLWCCESIWCFLYDLVKSRRPLPQENDTLGTMHSPTLQMRLREVNLPEVTQTVLCPLTSPKPQ